MQLYLYMEGLRGKGFSPELDFHLNDCLCVFFHGKGNYYFFDETEREQRLKEIKRQIISKKIFAEKLKRKANRLYRQLLSSSRKMKESDLDSLDDYELLRLFKDLSKAFSLAPVLTMPAFGVDACLEDKFALKQKLKTIDGGERQMIEAVSSLSFSREPTAIFLERKSLLEIVVEVSNDVEASNYFVRNNSTKIAATLPTKFPSISVKLDKHIQDFQWINAEYVSPPWRKERYIDVIRELVQGNPRRQLNEHNHNFASCLRKRNDAISQYGLKGNSLKAADALEEFMREFDWSKAYYCKTFLNWRPFIRELAKRMRISERMVLFHVPNEIEDFLVRGKTVRKAVLGRRMKSFVLRMLNGRVELFDEGAASMITKEGVEDVVFGSAKREKAINGVAASPGLATGRVRVITSVKQLPSLKKGEVLVTYMTTMELTPAFHKAAAVVTDEGGLFSHAAIVSREFKLPCVVGTKNGTRMLKTGDFVEVDAFSGIVRRLR